MASLFCPVCGTENPPTRQFCRKCASDLHAPAPGPNAIVEPEPAPAPIRPILIGIAIAAVLIALLLGALALLGGSPTATPSPTPSAAPTAELTAAPSPAPTLAPQPTPGDTVIETVAPTTEPTSGDTPAPGESGPPSVDSLSGPSSASCTDDNGTGTPGYIHLTWTASNTTGVRLSIDPPAPNKAYDYGYHDYAASGSADLPFTCDPPGSDSRGEYHQYVATTIHDGGYFAWRFIKVYLKG